MLKRWKNNCRISTKIKYSGNSLTGHHCWRTALYKDTKVQSQIEHLSIKDSILPHLDPSRITFMPFWTCSPTGEVTVGLEYMYLGPLLTNSFFRHVTVVNGMLTMAYRCRFYRMVRLCLLYTGDYYIVVGSIHNTSASSGVSLAKAPSSHEACLFTTAQPSMSGMA
jgi:hypothetical protein